MGWLDIRSTIDTAIDEFGRQARLWHEQYRTLEWAQGVLHQGVGVTNANQNGIRYLDAVVPEWKRSPRLLEAALKKLEEYLADVDPDNSAGSIKGLPTPSRHGSPHGGNGGPNVEPPRQPVTDVSRRRTHVFTTQREAGLADLLELNDGIIALRLAYLRAAGHMIGRHDADVTDQQLKDRAFYGRDPMTGTDRDWESGRAHKYSKHATAFVTNEAMVFAEMRIHDSRANKDKRESAVERGRTSYQVDLPAIDVFGADFRQHIRGWTRVGSVQHPQSAVPTSFPDDTFIKVVYVRDSRSSEEWIPYTCYVDTPSHTGTR